MPPRKKPKTLHEISLRSVASVTNKLCVDIECNFGGWKCPVSREKLSIVKTYLSTIQPLFDDLCRAIYDLCFVTHKPVYQTLYNIVNDKYLLLDVLMCSKLRKLDFTELSSSYCFDKSEFWKCQFPKLNNVVKLDILKVQLTDESFQAIGDVCVKLKEICVTSDHRRASMESLSHLLECKELQNVRIDFRFWEEERKYEYIRKFVTGLPKLEYFYDWLQWNMELATLIATPVTSMRKVQVKSVNSVELATIIRLCPNLKDIALGVHDDEFNGTREYEEKAKVLNTLAESSLQLHTLALDNLTFSQEMTRLITSKCTNLTYLNLSDCEGKRISVNDIYTIGISCSKIEDLRISDSYCDIPARRLYIQSHSPNMEEQTFLTTPRMFVQLKALFLHSNIDWDQRILPLILRHANNLTDISLRDIFKPTSTSQDILTELLNGNALQELESLSLEFECYGEEPYTIPLPIHSIERLVDCCAKLCDLELRCPMDYETVRYLRELARDMKRENFEFSLEFERVFML